LKSALVADTGGLLRALACDRDGAPSFPEYEEALTSASSVIVPGLVLAEVDYFLRDNRAAMRRLVAESSIQEHDTSMNYRFRPTSPDP